MYCLIVPNGPGVEEVSHVTEDRLRKVVVVGIWTNIAHVLRLLDRAKVNRAVTKEQRVELQSQLLWKIQNAYCTSFRGYGGPVNVLALVVCDNREIEFTKTWSPEFPRSLA